MSNPDSPERIAPIELGPGETLLIPVAIAHRFTARRTSRAIAFGKGLSPLTDRYDADFPAS